MAQQYPASWKNCATCVYWSGTRKTNYFGEWVKTESAMAKGLCLCRDSGWFRRDKQANASCVKGYEKWPVLKK